MTFSQAQSRGRLLRFLVDNLGQEITSGSFAGAGSFLAVNANDELVLANVDTAALVNDVFVPIDASNAYSTSSIRIGDDDAGPDRKLDVLDASNPQLRLTHTDGSKFVDMQVDTNHDLTITPSSTGQIKLQPTTDSTDFFQVLDTELGTPILNVDSINGRVGIGIAAPTNTLDVVGTVGITSGLYVADAGIIHTGDPDTTITFGSNTQIYTCNGNERFKMNSVGTGLMGATPIAGLAITGDLTVSEDIDIASGQFLRIGSTAAVSDSGNAITIGSTANDKTLILQSDFGAALSIDAGGFLTVPMGFSSSLGTSITPSDLSAANEWVKVAEYTTTASTYYATAVIDVMLAGYDSTAEIYQARVHLRAGPSTTSYSICQVDIIQDAGSEPWDTSDFVLTQKTSTTYQGQLWVRSPPNITRCYATITNGTSDGSMNYKTDWYLKTGQTWTPGASPPSLGTDVTTTNVKKRFDSLVIDGDLTAVNLNVATDIIHVDNTNTKITFGTNTQIYTCGGNERFRMNSIGVGIMGATPIAGLAVTGDITATGDLNVTNDLRVFGSIQGSGYVDVITLGPGATDTTLAGDLTVEGGDIKNSGGLTTITMNADGSITSPLQPAFFAHRITSNQTAVSAGAFTTVAFNSERFDVGGDFCPAFCFGTDYAFTAPVTGKYYLESRVRLGTIEYWWDYIWLRLNIENGSRYLYGELYAWQTGGPGEANVDAAYWPISVSGLVDLTAGEDVVVQLRAWNGTGNNTTWTVAAGSTTAPYSYFTGWLVG